jgi:hypothetical protein
MFLGEQHIEIGLRGETLATDVVAGSEIGALMLLLDAIHSSLINQAARELVRVTPAPVLEG